MSTRSELNESFKKAFVLKAIPFLTEIYKKTNLGYNTINIKEMCAKFEVQPLVVPTMLDLQILQTTGGKQSALFHWKGGPVNNELAEKIYDRIQLNKKTEKLNKQLSENHDSKITSRKLVSVVGSKRPMEFANNIEAGIILRAMKVIHMATKDGYVKTKNMLFDIAQRATVNDVLAERLLKGLIDVKYLVVSREMPNPSNSLYAWKETEPNEEHALFIQEVIKETESAETANENRVNRVFNFLNFLFRLKVHTHVKMRSEVERFNLTYNHQTVIVSEVLDYIGPKVERKYKWKLNETPSMELAESLEKKVAEYGAKYHGKDAKKKEAPVATNEQVILPVYKNNHKLVIDYLRNPSHKLITIETACVLTNLNKAAVSNIFWKLCKDGITFKSAHKTYKIHDKYKNAIEAPVTPVVEKTVVEKEKKVEQQKTEQVKPQIQEDAFITNLRNGLNAMKEKRNSMQKELDEMDAKIREGQELLNAKEKENAYLASISKYIGSGESVSTAMSNSQKTTRERLTHAHDKKTILETLKQKEQVSLAEFIELFYPGQKLNSNSKEVKSLTAMVYGLKKEGIVVSPSAAVYKLVKK